MKGIIFSELMKGIEIILVLSFLMLLLALVSGFLSGNLGAIPDVELSVSWLLKFIGDTLGAIGNSLKDHVSNALIGWFT